VSVTPIEWWDAKWIRDRVSGPLKAAGIDVAGLEPSSDDRSSSGRAR